MRAIAITIATIALAGFVTQVSAQSGRAKMEEMKAKHPRDYAHCQALASQLGYRLGGTTRDLTRR